MFSEPLFTIFSESFKTAAAVDVAFKEFNIGFKIRFYVNLIVELDESLGSNDCFRGLNGVEIVIRVDEI